MIGSANTTAWFPEGASTHAAGVDGAFLGIYVLAICALVVTAGLAMVFVRTFLRRDGDPERMPAGSNNKLWLGLWVLGAVLLAGFAFQSGLPAFVDQNVAPYGAYTVGVTAREGAWDFTYPNGHVADTLRVEVGRPTRLVMTSADVAQGMAIPALRVQQTIFPGRTTEAWFEATAAGDFPIYSDASSVATQDSLTARLLSLSTTDFQAWLATVEDIFAGRTLAEVGELLYTKQGCMACHTLNGAPLVGPSFQNIYGHEVESTDGRKAVVDAAYIKESILTPNAFVVAGFQPVMTPYAGKLDDREIEAITEFLKSLSDHVEPAGDAAADEAPATDGTSEDAQEEK
ncbi:c-type cytochrome [bacterium]|nr:c-type cytochrome [bacterium]